MYFVGLNREAIFYLNDRRREWDRHLKRTWERSAWMHRTAQTKQNESPPAITLVGKRCNDFSPEIIEISGCKILWKQKQKKIIIFLTSHWWHSLTLSIFHTKQSRVSPAETPPYIMFDKYLKGNLFHPAEPFQPTDETETAATGEEWKCEQNTERSSEY